ncbi:MAG: FecR domain-containing protein [Pyrinomonadaceae bacterium]
MDENKYRKFYVEWWKIRKSTIYGVIAVLIFGALAFGGFKWASSNNWFLANNTVDYPKDAGKVIHFEGEVRITRASTRETIIVRKETYVAGGDTVQTMDDGRAIIEMIDGSRIQLRANSTMVVKDMSSFLGGKDVRVSVDDGQINVRTNDQPEGTNNIVEVADSESRLLSNTDASFDADSATNGGEIRVSRGGVETTIGGQKTTISENEFAAVNGGKLSAREKLMAPPRPQSPNNSGQIVDSRGSGVNVGFSWQDPEGNPAASYYLQISSSPTFASDAILVDRSGMTSRSFRLNLLPGTYYWRLRATGRSGQTTNWNDAWKFMVVRSGDRVAIEASEWKADNVGGSVYLLSGRTLPGMTVRSQGRETNSGPDGTFRLQISSPSVETAVEIGDDRGNRKGFIISLRNGRVLRSY